jgi:membrane protease YdiL (CAAX protease family)
MRWFRFRPDYADLVALAALYIAVVIVFRVAFQVVTSDNGMLLFVVFAVIGLLGLGVAAPVGYTVLARRRTLDSLGVGLHRWRESLVLGSALAAVQFTFTLAGYDLPAAVDWVPLLLMSVVVGLFEAIFFRGFIQNRLEASFGVLPAILGAAGLYSLYHVGYEMGAEEMLFLFGLGIFYAAIFRLTSNILVLWPLLTPMGAFYNNLESGDIELPWLSMVGFGEVLAAMIVLLFLAHRYTTRRTGAASRPATRDTLAVPAGHLPS